MPGIGWSTPTPALVFRRGADVTGAALVTSALTLGVYAIVSGSAFALPLGGLAMLLMAGFVVREATAANPLLGLAVLAAVATARTDRLIEAGHSLTPACPAAITWHSLSAPPSR